MGWDPFTERCHQRKPEGRAGRDRKRGREGKGENEGKREHVRARER